jgi:hypothetical protein
MKNYTLNFFEKWMLKRIAKKAVLQSYDHKKNIETYYQVIVDAAKKEFNEDNEVTICGLLSDCHKKSLIKETTLDNEGKEILCTI